MTEIIISFDIETTGQIPGLHSMISIGAVPILIADEKVGGEMFLSPVGFHLNMEEVYGRDDDTMEWWKDKQDQWATATVDPLHPSDAMKAFSSWASNLRWLVDAREEVNLVLAANPAIFDGAFIRHYGHVFARKEFLASFGRCRVLDIRSVLSDVLNTPYSKTSREVVPSKWMNGLAITHNALEDARQQAYVLMHALEKKRELHL